MISTGTTRDGGLDMYWRIGDSHLGETIRTKFSVESCPESQDGSNLTVIAFGSEMVDRWVILVLRNHVG